MPNNTRAVLYIIKEMLPSLFLGIFVFISILLMFQMLKLTELLLVHGLEFRTVFELVLYLSIRFLPAILPMSVLLSVLMTYGRLSSDSEIIAFKSLGISQTYLTLPAFSVGILMTLISFQTYFFIGPWGQAQFEKLIAQFSGAKVVSTLRAGTFADGFYNLVVYSNEINEREGILKDVFIYDERNSSVPVTIIARRGQVMNSGSKKSGTVLRLFDGSIHRSGLNVYTKIKFENYDIFLDNDFEQREKEKSPRAMTIRHIKHELSQPQTEEFLLELKAEFHKRWALPIACLIFSLIGVGLGTVVNKRVARSGGFVISIALIVIYWVMYISIEALIRNQTLSIMALWVPNALFALFSFYVLRLIWKK